jgi:hypothetical protein
MYLETEDNSFCDVQTDKNVEIQSGFRQTSYPSHRDPAERGLDPPTVQSISNIQLTDRTQNT